MPNKRTFQIKPISELIKHELNDNFIDPFPFESKIDCFDFFKNYKNESVLNGVLDPPYTKRQVSEHYKKNKGFCTGWHTSSGWVSKVKDEMARIIKPNGKVITFSYNSTGLGLKRGFRIIRILLVCHGAEHNDTICTVEKKEAKRY